MESEFITITLTRSEALELHAALVARAILEDDVRREKGLEPVSSRPMLEKIDTLVRLTPPQQERLAQALDDELWEFSWYRFTDEWAWFRAKKEVEQELGDRTGVVDPKELQGLIERRYERDFETFLKEVEMLDDVVDPTGRLRP